MTILHFTFRSLFLFFICDHKKGKEQRVDALTIQMHYVPHSKIDLLPFFQVSVQKRTKEDEWLTICQEKGGAGRVKLKVIWRQVRGVIEIEKGK